MSNETLSHEQLVLRAGKWLQGRSGAKCAVVAMERISHASCIPDAIGWTRSGVSSLIECKTSRSDFFADQKKHHRQHGSVGVKRYYMTPAHLVKPAEVPEGWGLLYCYKTMVRVIVHPLWNELTLAAKRAEKQILIAQVITEQRGHVNYEGDMLISHPDYVPG